MQITSFIIELQNGKILWKSDNHKDMFNRWLGHFKDGQYRLEVNSLKSKRSDEQNRYLWLYYEVVSEDTGYTPEEIHEWAKGKFLTRQIKELFGDKVRVKTSTTKLTKGQFSEYLMKIEEATSIPLPNTKEYFGFSYHK